ncbi:MAG: alcohol dehydrogenase catalytic domain-containing protein, partial [Acidimicrobiales bacterium]
MKALLLRRFGGEPVAEEVPDPVAGPGEVVVDVAGCGVGLTTRNCLRGDLGDDPSLLPLVPGHELVGTVTAAGPGAGDRLVGQLVTAHFYLFCGWCPACLSAR